MRNNTEPDSHTRHVVVIGAGVVGVASAIWLQREGFSVTLIDKSDVEDKASFGNAGVLASASVIPVTVPGLVSRAPRMLINRNEPVFLRWNYILKLLPWAVRYLSHANQADAYRIAAALTPIIGNSLEDHLALAEGSPAVKRIKPCDFCVLFKDRETFNRDQLPWDIRRENGFTWTEIEGADRKARAPMFDSAFDFMAVLDGHGQINDPGSYLNELIEHFVEVGGTLLVDEVTDIRHEKNRVTGVQTHNAFIAASNVAVTAGAWSPLLTRKLGMNIPLEAESGYHLEFWGADPMPSSPVLIPSCKFILTPMEGRLRAAGAVEFGGLGNHGREQPWALIKAGVHRLMPDFTYDKETRWIGHRPAPTDSIPIIDQLPHIEGVFVGCGHQHVGLTGSARTGQLLAQMIAGKAPDIDMHPYRIDRFGKTTARRLTQQSMQQHSVGKES